MIFSVVQKMFWLLLICALARAFPHINIYTKEQTKIVFENTVEVVQPNRPELPSERPNSPNRLSSLIFPDDRIYFPDRRKEIAPIRYESRRFTALRFEPRFRFFQNRMIQHSQNPRRNDVDRLPNSGFKLPDHRPTVNEVKPTNRADDGQERVIFPQSEQAEKSTKNDTTISWFERLINRKKLFFGEYQTGNTSASPEDENGGPIIAFQSLFRLPTLRGKMRNRPCPPNERRNHYGDCVRPHPVRIALLDDSKS